MQVPKRHITAFLIGLFLIAVLIVSLFIVQNASKPSPSATPSPAPTASSPTPTGTTSPTPTVSSSPTPSQIGLPSTVVPTNFLPGEVSQYEGQSLTPITVFLYDLAQHPDVSIEGTQELSPSTYRLTVTGLVNHPVEYTYDEVVNNFTSYQNVATLFCVEGWDVTCLWQGVLLSDLINEAGVSPNATTLIFTASDGYTTSFPLDYALQTNMTLAYKMNNLTLTPAAGWPFMLIPQNQYGYKWIRWVTQIDVSNDSSYLGYWESRGYPNNATVGGPSVSPASAFAAAETLGFVGVFVVVAVASYIILVRVRRRYSSRKEDEHGISSVKM
ncbi:MAG: molybdopterin-dependent oxidoreductase [Candidatus Bathyarchaeia archaeon]